MEKNSFILKGNICFSKTQKKLSCTEHGFLVCENGISQGVFKTLPEQYSHVKVIDYGDSIIIPGMIDLHLHAPQYASRGTGMDLELLDWLNIRTFPEEQNYENLHYAQNAYGIFAEDLKNSATTRAVIFATIHTPSTILLMDMLEKTGLITYVGKVNMDRNCAKYLSEGCAETSLNATSFWLDDTISKYQNTLPILTPRFAPSCSNELLEGLGKLREEYHLPVQSHLSENLSEIELVKQLYPWSSCYGDVYESFGLLGGTSHAVMAHCVHSSKEELHLLSQNNIYIAHCPQSNMNLSSGIAPIRKYLELGIHTGLGTDIAGGASLSMFRCISDAIMVSKLRWRLMDQELSALTFAEAFYLATLGGGSFFGKVGSFEKGYELDALIIKDTKIRSAKKFSLEERLERYTYLTQECGEIVGKYVAGRQIL